MREITGKTHAWAGGFAAALTLHLLHAPSLAFLPGLALGVAAGLLPDIDTESSTASHMIPGYGAIHSGQAGRWMAALALVIAGPWAIALLQPDLVAGLPAPLPAWVAWTMAHVPHRAVLALPVLAILFLLLSWLLRHLLHHRGATHSLAALAGVWYLSQAFLDRWSALAIIAGYASHLVADLITREGDCLAWPLYRHPVGLGHIPGLRALACKTGDAAEQRFWRPAMLVGLVGTLAWHLWAVRPGA